MSLEVVYLTPLLGGLLEVYIGVLLGPFGSLLGPFWGHLGGPLPNPIGRAYTSVRLCNINVTP